MLTLIWNLIPLDSSESESVQTNDDENDDLFNIVIFVLAVPINLYLILIVLCSGQLRTQPKYLVKAVTAMCSLWFLYNRLPSYKTNNILK